MHTIKTIAICSLAAIASGCAGSKPQMYTPSQAAEAAAVPDPAKTMPEWVMKGAGAFPDEPKTVFFGVGVANSMPNIALLREAADSRARGNVASEMKATVAKLTRDYMDLHVNYFNQDAAGSDEFVSVVAKLTTDATLYGCRIVDRWQDPKTGAFYSLARMDNSDDLYKQYKASLKKAISDEHLAVVTAKRDEAEKALDAEVEKQRKREDQILGK